MLYDPDFDEERMPVSNGARKALTAKQDSPSYRTNYRQDFGRLIHSAAFRRLQGKTQLFPSYEDDFFRNRLTHSIEVAQIAKGIALKLNCVEDVNAGDYFVKNKIDLDLVEFAALAHDLGHPPFGHNGEEALDELMLKYGGFEGNAQTLHILSRLEKKIDIGMPFAKNIDRRRGLNLTARAVASILKYDKKIPVRRSKGAKVNKGYYASDSDIVSFIKKNMLRGSKAKKSIKTIECSIMDVSDDIAYSTYDLEDTFKAGFTDPLELISANPDLLENVTKIVNRNLIKKFKEGPVRKALGAKGLSTEEVRIILISLFKVIFSAAEEYLDSNNLSELTRMSSISSRVASSSKKLTCNGYSRTEFTSRLVKEFVESVHVTEFDKRYPALSQVGVTILTFAKIEILKRFNFECQILGSRLQVAAHRGKKIVSDIFLEIEKHPTKLLPADFQELYKRAPTVALKKRVICDFVAGMTDRYAVEYHTRLCGSIPPSIYKPF